MGAGHERRTDVKQKHKGVAKEPSVEVRVSGRLSFDLDNQGIDVPASVAAAGEAAIREWLNGADLQIQGPDKYGNKWDYPLGVFDANLDGLGIEIEKAQA
jgi:hypothetical protein